ncbi:hypothetical protein PIROE2DRAFT_34050, partial [Piromyces sp. E2]
PDKPQPTPYTHANIFSKLTYSWENKIFNIGYQRPIEDNDIYLLDPKFKEEGFEKKFYEKWDKSLAKKGKASVVKTLAKVFGAKWASAGIIKLCSDLCNTISPVFLELLLTHLGNREEGKDHEVYKGWVYVACIFLLQFFATVFTNTYMEIVSEVGMSVRSTIVGVIYRKALKLSNKARQSIGDGQIVNLVSSDANRLERLIASLHFLWSGPVQLTIILVLLIRSLGVWALIGFTIFVVVIPLQGVIMKLSARLRQKTAVLTDQRVKKTQEVLGSMRIIKFFGWEQSFLNVLSDLRKKELNSTKKAIILRAETSTIFNIVPFIASALTFIAYSAAGNVLTEAKVFSCIAFFNKLRAPLAVLPNTFSQLTDAWVSMKRLNNLLNAKELDDLPEVNPNSEYAITIENGQFNWESKSASDDTVNSTTKKQTESFRLKDINIKIKKGSLTAIVGTVGSGKSSLINAIIGEMKREEGKIVHGGTFSYCSQQAWIQNATIRDNIIFGKEYDEALYDSVIENCSLSHDLEVFQDGDMTEIGERGITLSGGQKQRINLARAVYYDSDIILMDDPLSAVDAHVSRALFDNCILGALGSKTRVLVTHQLHVLPDVDYIIVMKAGRIEEQGEYDELMKKGGEFARLMRTYGGIDDSNDAKDKKKEKKANEAKKEKKEKKEKKDKGKALMTKEERATGSVDSKVYKDYLKAAGGIFVGCLVLLVVIVIQLVKLGNDLWLVTWTKDKSEENHPQKFYILIYLAWNLGQVLLTLFYSVFMAIVGIRAARRIHRNAITRILMAPVSFFDTTPLGRIINRFSKDQDSIDGMLFMAIQMLFTDVASTVTSISLMIYTAPLFGVALIPLLLLYYFVQEYYRSTSRELKRIESITRSPLYTNITETLVGLPTIRAYDAQERFIKANQHLIDENNRPQFLQINAQRWLGLRLESIGAFLILFNGIAGLLLKNNLSSELLGLSMSYALQITQTLNGVVRSFADTEVNMNSAERLLYYANDIEIEDQKGLEPPKEWPDKGKIEFKNMTMKYAPDLPPVLHNITLDIKSYENIGVVGRTGAGKSSIIMTLFRLVEPELGSSIKIDDISILDLKLSELRKRIAIIPQEPTLFSGTIRFNMDPFNEH